MKRFGLVALMAIASGMAYSATSFTFVRQIEYLPHPIVGNLRSFVADTTGGLYICDSGTDDELLYCQNALVSDGSTDNFANTVTISPANPDAGGFGSNESWTGISFDGASTYYASGHTAAGTIVAKVTGYNPWTFALVTGVTGINSGCTAVSANTIVMANYNTGALQFYTVSGTVASALGSPIANPSPGVYKSNSVLYYDAPSGSDKIFVSMVADNFTRRVDVFNTNGTPGGTTYVGTFANPVAGSVSASTQNLRGSMNIQPTLKILAVPVNNGTDNGWDIFDIAAVGTGEAPVATIRASTISGASLTFSASASGFFTKAGTDYFAAGANNDIYVYSVTHTSSVDDWQLFN